MSVKKVWLKEIVSILTILYHYQDKNFEKIEKKLSFLCEWFIDKKLSIDFGVILEREFS